MQIRRHFLAVLVALSALFALTVVVSASPTTPTPVRASTTEGVPSNITSTLRVVSATMGFEVRGDILADLGGGAVGFNLYFARETTAMTPTITAGPGFTGQCSFSVLTNPAGGTTPPTTVGLNVAGFCNTGATATISGTNQLIATVTFGSCTTATPIDLDGTVGNTSLVDPNGNEFVPTVLVDGVACVTPTAITLDTLNADSPTSGLLVPTLAVTGALVAVGGLVLLRRRRRS
jgi:hypothetical protein